MFYINGTNDLDLIIIVHSNINKLDWLTEFRYDSFKGKCEVRYMLHTTAHIPRNKIITLLYNRMDFDALLGLQQKV